MIQRVSADQQARFRKIGQYYENDAVKCWEYLTRGHLHQGYWDEANADAEVWAGPLRLTELMIEWTPIGEGQRLIDFGSGQGLPAITLAEQKGCLVDGVDASRYHTDIANRNAASAGLADKCKFSVNNWLSLPCPDDTYDCGWFLESIFHMDHAESLREAHRVLKSGSILLITDIINVAHTSEDFLRLQHETLNANHGNKEDYPRLLEEAGFELLALDDLTEEVIVRTGPKYHQCFDPLHPELLEIADEDYLMFVDEVNNLFAANTGYISVQARAL